MNDAFPSDERQPISFPTWKIELESVAEEQRSSVRMHLLDLLHYAKDRHAPVTIALVKQYLAEGRGGRDGARPALRWFCSGGRVVPENWKSGKVEGGKVENREIGKVENWKTGAWLGGSAQSAERPQAGVEGTGAGGTPALPGGDITGEAPGSRSTGSAARRSARPTLAAEDLGGAEWERDLITAIRSRGLLWRTEETYRGWARRFAKSLAPRSPYAAETEDVAVAA